MAPSSVFTVGGETFTAAPTGFAVSGTTLSPNGPAVTIGGTAVSLGPPGLPIGSSTISLAATTPAGLGAYILSAFDAPAATTVATTGNGNWSANGTALTGSGTRLKSNV